MVWICAASPLACSNRVTSPARSSPKDFCDDIFSFSTVDLTDASSFGPSGVPVAVELIIVCRSAVETLATSGTTTGVEEHPQKVQVSVKRGIKK